MMFLTQVNTRMFLNTSIFRLFIIGFLACSLGACGQAGPLYLPQDTEAQSNDQNNEQTEQEQQSNTPAQQAPATLNAGQVQDHPVQAAQVTVEPAKVQQ